MIVPVRKPVQCSNGAVQSDAGTARPCPPRSQGLAAPMSDVVTRSPGPSGASPCREARRARRGVPVRKRDRGVGTLAGGPHAPSRAAPAPLTSRQTRDAPENRGDQRVVTLS